MAFIDITGVFLDKEEYSQYERDANIVTTTITGTPAIPANLDQLTIEIRKARRNRDVVVASTTYTFDGIVADFDTTGVNITIDLTNVVSSPDLIRLLRSGEYFIRVYDTANPTTITEDSDDFFISLITLNRFRESYLFGLDLQANEVRGWKLPPRNITGITLKEISRAHPCAFFTLALNVNTENTPHVRTLSWAGGDAIFINETVKQTYILPGELGQEFVLVEVDPRRLPTSSVQEKLLVEEDQLDDERLREFIEQARGIVENTKLQLFLEPTRCVTNIDPTQITFSTQNLSPIVLDSDWDVISQPVTFYPNNASKWINIQMPHKHVLRVDSLFGAVANTRIVDINLEWIEIAEAEGFLELVPFNQEIAFDFVGLVYVEALRGQVPIPSFWRYNLIAGLRDTPFELIEWVGRIAAIPVLTIAGQAFRSGYSSQSISRDGVSESVSYTASAIYGIYSASIEDHKRWIKEHEPQFRATYRGMTMVAL